MKAFATAVPLTALALVAGILLLDDPKEAPAIDACQVVGEVTTATGDVVQEIAGFTGVQLRNAAVVINTATDRGLGDRGARIGLITAIQESGLRNLANAGAFTYPARGSSVMSASQWAVLRDQVRLSLDLPNDGVAPGDWDSIGLFQGRLSAGWGGTGTLDEQVRNLLDPSYTTGRFYDSLESVQDWQDLEPTLAAQAVQRSAFPHAYARHWAASGELYEALAGVTLDCGATSGEAISAHGWTKPITTYKRMSSAFGMRLHPTLGIWRMHNGQDFSADNGTPIYAAADGTVVKAGRAGPSSDLNWVIVDHGGGVHTYYLHSEDHGILVRPGQPVTGGQSIALVGSSGRSTGPHLHFEVRVNGQPVEPMAYLASRGITY
ncbi:M23 family metallopeptidase [Actinotalea sp. K2]|uniref:M23 family metallopeptidase n=1 Tax=Actinotalea sp. K2 TaxID=2939438 RepID=UPI0020172233|nr:M23 family metallopeptidase [Actinotalea sp. K2]MCL3863022.1 M23 family metallopeptidase [Actinotalea sp. K2]